MQSQERIQVHVPVARTTPPFPMFVGRGRSGNTLLRAIFDSHPEMAIPHESHFMVPMGKERARYELRAGFAVEPFLRKLSEVLTRWELPEDEARSAFEEHPPEDYPDAVRTLYGAYARRHGKKRYGDKTPIQVLHIGYLARLFPETKFVHIIRDGRDGALSYMGLTIGPNRLDDAAVHWKRFVKAGRRAGRSLGSSRYREIRYEDLIRNPETVVRGLCPFLGLEFEPAMLQYYERAEKIVGSRGHHRNLYQPPTTGLRDWRKEMSRDQVALFEALAGDLLEDLGYERAFRPVPRIVRLEARRRWVGVQAHRAMRRTRKALGVGAHHGRGPWRPS